MPENLSEYGSCIGYEALSVGTGTAVAPTPATVNYNAVCAVFYVDPSNSSWLRYRPDGTAPTAMSGVPLSPGQSFVVTGQPNIAASRFIAGSAGSTSGQQGGATVHCLYYDRATVVAFAPSASLAAPAGPAPLTAANLPDFLAAIPPAQPVAEVFFLDVPTAASDLWREVGAG